MYKSFLLPAILLPAFFSSSPTFAKGNDNIPHLSQQGNATQLIVEGKPFLMLGGELGNSSFTSVQYMNPIWPKLVDMHLNTVLAPVYWELIEPQEGKFDFKLLDQLVSDAERAHIKLVFLWFGAWKNSMSSHVPTWVKLDEKRFPRIKDDKGKSQEILTPFSDNNLNADKKAFAALMAHIKTLNEGKQTVLMIQAENEIGMLPTARDNHPLANKKFEEDVPSDLMKYLQKNKDNLSPAMQKSWQANGYKTKGNWEAIFGKSAQTDEFFMAWYYGAYTNEVVAAGKAKYPLPMYVNAALNKAGALPGKEYPSAGPLPHVIDIWKAAAPAIDMLSPDFYNPDFKHWNDLYYRSDNPLFIPEHKFDSTVATKAVYAVGHYNALGFSPFSIESKSNPEKEDIGKMYDVLQQLSPVIATQQGFGKMDAVLLDKDNPESKIHLGDYEFTFKHSYTLGWEAKSKDAVWAPAAGIIVQVNDNEFYVAGTGIVVTFKNLKDTSLNVGILRDEEGNFMNGKWNVVRYLNGDETHQGRHLRIFSEVFAIQRLELYNYK